MPSELWRDDIMMNLFRASMLRCLRLPGRSTALAVLASIAMLGGNASATDPGNVVEDGQFGLGEPRNPFSTYSAGQTVGGWKVDVGNVDVNTTYFKVPDDQSNSVDLNGTATGAISQVLETVVGKTYTVRFLVSGNWDIGSTNRTLALRVGPLSRSLSIARPRNWSRTNMGWRQMSYPFIANSTTTTISFRSTVTSGPCGPVIANVSVSAPVDPPNALETIPVPTPPDLNKYVANREAAILLGKALFWDMQTGSDGKTACATCHWHAGADARTKNTLNPGAPGSTFGHQTSAGPALAADALANFPGVNLKLKPEDFPFRRLRVMDEPESASNPVLFDSKKVVGSQGVISKKFLNIEEGNPVDNGQVTPHPVFNINGVNSRQVTARNAPTTINAIFFDRSFWDGRANRYFNGVNPFGNLDPNARVLKYTSTQKTTTTTTGTRWVWKSVWLWIGYWTLEPVTTTKTETVNSLDPVSILIDNGALASQAVGPPNNSVEMSWDGRVFRELARKMFSLRPLAQQEVSWDDSVLGPYVDGSGHGLCPDHGYAALIRRAFQPEWWSAPTPAADGFTQMESNFSLFWGLSIMLYESTLVSGDTPFDRFRKGDTGALSAEAKRGLQIFLNEGKCINCHGGPEFAGATVSQLRGVLSDDGPIELMPMAQGTAFYDGGFYNIGVRQTEGDIAVGASHPQFGPLSYSKQRQNGRDVGQAINVPAGARIAVNGAFKTPTLRNVELTGPYFHNGGAKNLIEVVDFYVRGADFKKQNIADLDPDVDGIPSLRGNEADQLALVAFMKHLTDERVKFRKAPFDHPQLILPNGHTGVENGVALDDDFVLPAVGREGGDPFMPFEEALETGY
jgi:choice-of-anchor C domain-containing protein